MNCFECHQPTEIKKYKVYHYEGINLNDVHLFNVEVVVCVVKSETSKPIGFASLTLSGIVSKLFFTV